MLLLCVVPLAAAACGTTAQGHGAAASTQAASAPPASLAVLHVAYPAPSGVFLPLFVAQQAGLFQKYGLVVHSKLLHNASVTAEALVSNRVQIALTGAQAMNLMRKGMPLAYVASWADYPLLSLYTTSKYRTLQQLVQDHATVAVSVSGGIEWLAMQLALEGQKGAAQGVRFVYAGSVPATVAALEAHKVDAAIISQPSGYLAGKSGFHDILDFGSMHKMLQDGAVVVNRRWAQAHAAQVQAFLKATTQAIAEIRSNPALAERALGQVLHTTDTAELTTVYRYFAPHFPLPPRVRSAALRAFFRLTGETSAAASFSRKAYVSDRYLNSLIKSGFIKGLTAGGPAAG